MNGKVWLVGAGPGDPGLITVRGLDVLRQAEVVLHDALSHPALLEACPRAELRDVGKRYGVRHTDQEAIIAALIALARAGKRVVRLKGGDPLLFARGAEEALALAEAGVPFEIVPGIPSPLAASAYSGIPLTHRGLSSSVTFITGSEGEARGGSPEAWHRLATPTDTLCVLMGMRRIEEIARALIAGGRARTTPAAVVEWAARPEQRVVTGTLDTIAQRAREARLGSPAVIMVGPVVELRQKLRWYDSRPLFGKRVLLPRAERQLRETAALVRERGAEPVPFPVIELHPPPDPALLERAARDVANYDWVVFTSANGVERFFEALSKGGLDARAFAGARVAAIGPKTASSIRRFGIAPDAVAAEFVAESLAELLLQNGARRVLLPRALVARDTLPDMLRRSGTTVDVVPAYETRPVPAERAGLLIRLLETGEVDVVTFTSSSTVSSVCDLLGERAAELLGKVTVASIGPITSTTAGERGLRVDVSATEYTLEGLLDALERHFRAAWTAATTATDG